MHNNEKILKILAEKGLQITHFIRYVYVLENDKEEILITYKTESAAIGNVYTGWQIFSEVHWELIGTKMI